ncbi:MAG: helix-turn-helix domain-containing protein [Candidatus Dojkabacteria bacterium]|nr:helix-turn-helix domain-containing protein [Candidatus Dojkabacteria bacterium]MDQ7020377.1 helix-turn-helix domain-containing protein [Candidatus Dojkabacteria bacterium]
MSGEADNLKTQLSQFDLSEGEVKVYLHLQTSGKSTPLEMSKKLKLSRTKVYRVIEKLLNKGLIIEKIEGHGKKYIAQRPSRFLEILSEKERELSLLQMSAPSIVNQLNSLAPQIDSKTQILHYRGVEGLKQVVWNTTKVDGTFRIYEVGNSMDVFLSQEFAERVRLELSKNQKNKFRQLTNLKEIRNFTNVTEHVKQWEGRHIPQNKLEIKVEIQIYNDCYAMYEYTKDEVFIVEIYNKELADMQKQVYDLIWESAMPMKVIEAGGRAILE